jgi:hypothetical protein
MKNRNAKQVMLREIYQSERRANEKDKEQQISLMYFLNMYKYGTLKLVNIIL